MSYPPDLDPPAILFLDAQGRVLFANAAAGRVFDAAPERLRGVHFPNLLQFELIGSDPAVQVIQWGALVEAAVLKPQPVRPKAHDATHEFVLYLDRVEVGDARLVATLLKPSPVGVGGASAPSSQSLADAAALLASRGGIGLFDLRMDTGQLVTSLGWKRMLGYTEAELPDTLAAWKRLVHPDDTSATPDHAPRRQPPGARTFALDYRLRHRDGRYLWVHCTGVRVFGPDGVLQRVCGMHLDITDRKELEELSLANDERLQRLAGQGPLAAFDLDFAAHEHWFSASWRRFFGLAASHEDEGPAVEPRLLLEVLTPEQRAAGLETFFEAESGEGEQPGRPVELRRADGTRVQVFLVYQRELDRRGRLARVTGYVVPCAGAPSRPGEPSPLVRQAACDVLAEGLLLADVKGRVWSANAKALALLGTGSVESVRGRPAEEVFRLVHRADGRVAEDAVDLALNDSKPGRLEDRHGLLPLNGGEPRPVVWAARDVRDSSGNLAGFVIVFRDPEEMSLTPEELVRVNRFESLGLLAGGIAHDFNNLLTTILGGITSAKESRTFHHLDFAEEACLAAKQLTRQLLTFAKGGGGQSARQVVALADVLQNSVRIAASGSPVVVKVGAVPDLQPVEIDKGQILQVFQNLIINAIQAMPVPADGRVVLRACNQSLAEGEFDELPAGDYVRVDVEDNGSGMPPEVLARIFTPFFTTKKTGTGLGLATVNSIVRRHGGRIGVRSTVGEGTTFTVFLPAAAKPLEAGARRAPSIRFGTGRVLFMDDDPKICEITGAMIASLDYTHDIARNGEEAIQLYRRYFVLKRPYDAVLLDLTVIGGMGGEECFKHLREIDPDVRAIVTSGYDDEDMLKQYLEMGFVGYLTKPYRAADLGRMLREVLSR